MSGQAAGQRRHVATYVPAPKLDVASALCASDPTLQPPFWARVVPIGSTFADLRSAPPLRMSPPAIVLSSSLLQGYLLIPLYTVLLTYVALADSGRFAVGRGPSGINIYDPDV